MSDKSLFDFNQFTPTRLLAIGILVVGAVLTSSESMRSSFIGMGIFATCLILLPGLLLVTFLDMFVEKAEYEYVIEKNKKKARQEYIDSGRRMEDLFKKENEEQTPLL